MTTRPHYDIVIVGEGTAGCVLAARLSVDRQRTVCLVEAGPDYGSFDHGGWPGDLLEPRALSSSHDWDPSAAMSLSWPQPTAQLARALRRRGAVARDVSVAGHVRHARSAGGDGI